MLRHLRRSFLFPLFLLLLLSAAHADDPASAFPTNEQLRHFKRMGDARLSPDAKHLLLSVTDATAGGAKSQIWLASTTGEEPRQLTFSPDADKRGEYNAEWMPDGDSILFLAKRAEHTSLYRLPMNGGEAKAFDLKVKPIIDESKLPEALPIKDGPAKTADAKPAEDTAIDIEHYSIAPDGEHIAIIAHDPETPGEKAQKDAKADAVWVDHDPHGSRLYLLDVTTCKLSLIPINPDLRQTSWSPDSSKLFALAQGMNNADDLEPAASSYLVSVSDTEHPVRLTSLPSTIETAAWLPDNQSFAYLAQARPDAPPGYSDLYTLHPDTHDTRVLTDGFQGSTRRSDPIPLPGGRIVQLVETGFHGKVALFTPGEQQPHLLDLPAADISSVSTNAARSGWLFQVSGGGKPPAILFSTALDSPPQTIKTPPLIPEHLLSVAPKEISWKSDAYTIHGLLYLPPQAAIQHVPLIVEVHGGPLGAYSDTHEPWADFLLGQGWAILRTNPRGSSGYGAAFAAANKNDLGGGDYRDIMAGIDFVLKTESIDNTRMALMGYSYGGEMAAFAEGKTTRFKAIISGAPVIDQNSEYGTEDASWYDRWYFGKPWEHPQDAWRQSPLANAGKARTPFLLLQGENDTTDPLGQSQEMYRSLRQIGAPVELITYPRDNHAPLAMALYGAPVPEPWHGFDARRRVVDFIHKAFAAPAVK